MDSEIKMDRRHFLRSSALVTSAALVAGVPLLCRADEKKSLNSKGVTEVSPVEDLMREHGALNRILLIYDEAMRHIQAKEELNPALLRQSAKLIQDFIENYHEKLEEEHLFPRLKSAHRLVDTVDTLLAQHRAGRRLTQRIMELCTVAHFKNASDLGALSLALQEFNKMYRPHAAREDTIVFPEFKKLLTPKEYDRLGDQFEDREHELFGKEGFDGIVGKIAELEKALGIYDLAKFSPRDS